MTDAAAQQVAAELLAALANRQGAGSVDAEGPREVLPAIAHALRQQPDVDGMAPDVKVGWIGGRVVLTAWNDEATGRIIAALKTLAEERP